MTQNKLGIYTKEQMLSVLERAIALANEHVCVTHYCVRYYLSEFDEQALSVYIVYVKDAKSEVPILQTGEVGINVYRLFIDNTNLSDDNYINRTTKLCQECGPYDKNNTVPDDVIYCKITMEPETLFNDILLPMMRGYNKRHY